MFSFRKQSFRSRGSELEVKAIQNHSLSKIANSSTWNNQYDIEKNGSLVSALLLIFLELFLHILRHNVFKKIRLAIY